ncbi:acyl-CoA dehydrogenase family protein [Paraburkholderia oxyphila]|uniref:acyl-CoA dehydrogenase family protein n=1 Tax=Paraburkholderia oxyphila TaxID=614212 RepID=UPI0014288BF4|nr:acyl-CoA dehydrogenase family protein [Paraburkholderia oxyphila]
MATQQVVENNGQTFLPSYRMVDDSWMSGPERALFNEALDFVGALKEREADCVRQRNVPTGTVDRFRETGLSRILQPKRYGGLQSSPLLLSRVVEELAMGCPSSAWVLSVFGEHAWVVGCFPEQAQDDVWGANPLAVVASSLAPRATAQRVKGGYQITGTYPFASGCRHAEWLIVGAWVEHDGGRSLQYMLVPMSEVTILDDWQTLGLRGTGSNTVSLDNVFVPEHRMVSDAGLKKGETPGSLVHPDYPLLKAPRAAFAIFTQLPVTLALARLVLEHTGLTMRGRVSRGMTTLSDSQIIQCKLGEAAADIDAAIFVAHRRHRHVADLIASGQSVSVQEAQAAHRDSVWANRVARRGIETLVSTTSAEIVHDRNSLQSWYRDSLTTGSHFGANWEAAMAPYGRMLLGMEG